MLNRFQEYLRGASKTPWFGTGRASSKSGSHDRLDLLCACPPGTGRSRLAALGGGAILYYIIVCYIILFYIMLFCFILYYTAWGRNTF